MMIIKVHYSSRSEFDDKDDKYKMKQQNNNIETKPPNVFNFFKKSLSQKAKDLMDKIEDANDDIVNDKLLFIGSNKDKFNFNTFKNPLNFISAIYNGKISLKEAEFFKKYFLKKRRAKI